MVMMMRSHLVHGGGGVCGRRPQTSGKGGARLWTIIESKQQNSKRAGTDSELRQLNESATQAFICCHTHTDSRIATRTTTRQV